TSARTDHAVQLSTQVPNNTVLDWQFGDAGATRSALSDANHVVSISVNNHRVAMNAMETRGALGWYDAQDKRYRITLSSQNVHVIRDHIAYSLGETPSAIRATAPDVGGGFGVRNFIYNEYVLVLWAAKAIGRPVKWTNTRSDGFLSDHQARDFSASARLGLDAEGRFLGLSIDCDFNLGAYLIGAGGGVPTGQFSTCPGSVYDIPAIHLDMRAVLTNTVPIGVTRGPGFAEMVDLMERLIDKAAMQCGLDRFELRRRNFARAEAMPWTNAVGNTVDSGDFAACMDRALGIANEHSASLRARTESRGMQYGLGLASHIKATGGLDEENVELRFAGDRMILTTGTQAIGQGHETTFRQILGTLLGVPFTAIDYVAGDTAAIAMGGGHGSSRATYMASTAMHRASVRIIDKGTAVAARLLQAPPSDIEFETGKFRIRGTDRDVDLFEVAAEAAQSGEPLDTYQHFRRDAMTYPNGCHIAEVAVAPDTGEVELLHYTAVDDYGVLVNPTIAEGQIHGAIAQGIGQALLEQIRYDETSGQLMSGSFMDYAMPRAADLPPLRVEQLGTRCTTNPLGIKGCGEAGAIAAFPAIANAIVDATTVQDLSGTSSAHRVWRQLRGGG
ncbi:MAG: molybdopterin-dependent oxidoreductase, partial [Chromatiales bacterium]|nr:molybdopterin-dependent oxidoreductase [Chromatiales bacterium]